MAQADHGAFAVIGNLVGQQDQKNPEQGRVKGGDGEIYIVTSGQPYTLRELIETTGAVMGASTRGLRLPSSLLRIAATISEGISSFTPVDPPVTHARIDLYMTDRDIIIDKAKNELGFSPVHTDLYEMLNETYQYHHARGDI